MDKIYTVFLDNVKIGTTQFEKSDASMGVVSGLIDFTNSGIGYNFIKSYCIEKEIELAADYPEVKIISTRTIEGLTVVNSAGIEIKGLGNQIEGMDSEGFDISIVGIPYPFYGEEFPNHLNNYKTSTYN